MRIWPFERKTDDTATITSPTDWLISLFGSTSIGNCSRAEALSLPAVSNAVRAISEAVATLDLNVVRVADGTEIKDTQHNIAQLFANSPNEWSSTFEFVRDIVILALTEDSGGLAWVNRVRGEVREIIILPIGRLTVEYRADTGEPVYRLGCDKIDSADVIHLRGPFSLSPLSMAMSAITTGTLLESHAKNLFKNGAKPSGWISMKKGLGDEGLKRMRSAWRSAFEGAENAGKTPILWDDASFNALTLNSTDAQFLENRKYQNLEICRAFRLPPSMAYELDRATWSNSEQMGKEFLTYTLEPWLHALEGCLRRALFSEDERKNYRIRFDRDDLTRASLTERASAINSLIASETINPNTGRAWLDLPSYPGGETYGNRNITVKPIAVANDQVGAPV